VAIEIERKFLVRDNSWRKFAASNVLIRQGYLSRDPERVVRIRRAGASSYLTIKSSFGKVASNALLRTEFEYSIPVEDADFMLDRLCLLPVINKRRFKVIDDAQRVWEVDEFISPHPALMLAEIELTHSDDEIMLPPWVGREVTHDQRYSNNNIASATLD